MNREPAVRMLGLGLAAVGIVLAAIAGWLVINAEGTDDWVEVEGVVVDVDKEEGAVIGTTIRYRDADDNAYELKSDYGTEESRRGENVMLQYNPADPTSAVLSGESLGTPIHAWFVLVFGLLAVWGVAIAFFDPQLPELVNRPGAAGFGAIWMTLTSLVFVLTQRDGATGFGEIVLWVVFAGAVFTAWSLWRVLNWARFGTVAYGIGNIGLAVAVLFRSDNTVGAPMFWTLLYCGIWLIVVLSLMNKPVARAFERRQTRLVAAAS